MPPSERERGRRKRRTSRPDPSSIAIIMNDPPIINKPRSRMSLVNCILEVVERCNGCRGKVQHIVDTYDRCCPCPVCGVYFNNTTNIIRHIRAQSDGSHKGFNLDTYAPFSGTRVSLRDLVVMVGNAVQPCGGCHAALEPIAVEINKRPECPVPDCNSSNSSFFNTTSLRRHVSDMAARGDDPHIEVHKQYTSTVCRGCGVDQGGRVQKTWHEKNCKKITTPVSQFQHV